MKKEKTKKRSKLMENEMVSCGDLKEMQQNYPLEMCFWNRSRMLLAKDTTTSRLFVERGRLMQEGIF